jgi:GT2 family glycosyltransferase
MSKVFIGIPSKDSKIHARLVETLLPQMRDHLFAIVAGISPVAHARNMLVDGFLKTDATHLWMVDDDTIPPKDALEKMLAVDADIVTAVTPIIRENKIVSNIYPDVGGKPLAMDTIHARAAKGERFTVAGAGASCILIKRAVIEKLAHPYFAEVWSEDGNFMTEDIFFGNVAQEEGFAITCIPSVVCGHARTVVI